MSSSRIETATFAAGCFWGVEAAFRLVKGVKTTEVGYTGGRVDNPTYQQVCTDTTGHAEAVKVTFDSNEVSYARLLEVFFDCHDPTQLNHQGWDVGTQYRSAVFFHSAEQEAAARAAIARLGQAKRFRDPVVTQVVPAATFWPAEEYHQRYLEKRGKARCRI